MPARTADDGPGHPSAAPGAAVVPIGGPEGSDAHLVCFPHAGGSEMTFLPWRAKLTDRYRMWVAIRRPNGGPSAADLWTGVVATYVAELERLPGELTLYGHSMGALLAYETARALRAEGRPVRRLVVSGREAPHIGHRVVVPDDPVELARRVADRYGAIPAELLDDPETLRVVGEELMRDYTLYAAYRWRSAAPLDIPITAFAGADDPMVTDAGVHEWKRHTAERFHTATLPGGHFPGPEGQETILAELRATAT
ncbi:thioesterase [Nocardiopsis gilva YIM 90087]|uniref:Thioesterase n=1 Tax=Nocardiopsis gilva YIM 90087 TaxID=1235441 RepID=A0A223SAG0_9ACTN|nr:alpha/beta fold hydrolase [Nocardiopsis gilva]ASU85105.1 thioesterase [Nocardiopsis gilva YIM 90087]